MSFSGIILVTISSPCPPLPYLQKKGKPWIEQENVARSYNHNPWYAYALKFIHMLHSSL